MKSTRKRMVVAQIATSFGLLLFAAYGSAQVEDEKPLSFPDDYAAAWALQPGTGRLFHTLGEGDSVYEIDESGKKIRSFKIGRRCHNMIIKGNKLIVAAEIPAALHVIDLELNKIEGQIKVPLSTTLVGKKFRQIHLTASDIDNKYMYATYRIGGGVFNWELIQVDLEKLSIRNRLDVRQTWSLKGGFPNISRDGQWFEVIDRDNRTGRILKKFDEEKFSFSELVYKELPRYTRLDMRGGWTQVQKNDGYDPTRKSSRPFTINGRNGLLIKEAGIAMFGGSRGLHISNANDMSLIKMAFESEKPEQGYYARYVNYVALDKRNNRIFWGIARNGKWLDLDQLAKLANTKIEIPADASLETTVGSVENIPLLEDPKNSVYKFTLTKLGVEPVKLVEEKRFKDNIFVWKSSLHDVGKNEIRIDVLFGPSGETINTKLVAIDVLLPQWKLGLVPKTFACSPDNRWAVVSSTDKSKNGFEIQVVDIENQKVVSNIQSKQPVVGLAINESSVFIALSGTKGLFRFDHQFKKRKLVETPFEPRSLNMTDGKSLEVLGEKTTIVFDQLRLVETGRIESAVKANSFELNKEQTAGIPVIFSPSDFAEVSQQLPWNRKVVVDTNSKKVQILNRGGDLVFDSPLPLSHRLAHRHPFWLSVQKNQKKLSTGQMLDSFVVRFYDLIDGKVQKEQVVYDVPAGKIRSQDVEVFEMLNHIVIRLGQKWFYTAFPDELKNHVRRPLVLPKNQAAKVNVFGKASVTPHYDSLPNDVSYELVEEVPGVSINEESGEIQIDTSLVWRHYSELLQYSKGAGLNFSLPQKGLGQFNFSQIEDIYEKLAGNKLPSGQTVALLVLPIKAKTESSEDSMNLPILIVGPQKTLERVASLRMQDPTKQVTKSEPAQPKPAKMKTPGQFPPDPNSKGAKDIVEAIKLEALKKYESSQKKKK